MPSSSSMLSCFLTTFPLALRHSIGVDKKILGLIWTKNSRCAQWCVFNVRLSRPASPNVRPCTLYSVQLRQNKTMLNTFYTDHVCIVCMCKIVHNITYLYEIIHCKFSPITYHKFVFFYRWKFDRMFGNCIKFLIPIYLLLRLQIFWGKSVNNNNIDEWKFLFLPFLSSENMHIFMWQTIRGDIVRVSRKLFLNRGD